MRETLDVNLLREVKQAFVPMPGGMAEPVAGASMMTAGMVAPMGAPPAGDPSAGMPVDPSTGMPVDPAMMGVDPATGMPTGGTGSVDPAAVDTAMDPAAMDPTAGAPVGSVTMSIPELIQLIGVIKGDAAAGQPAAASEKPKAASTSAKIDEMLNLLRQAMGQPAGV